MSSIRVGTKLYGYCGGFFGRDDYNDKRVEALGADWVVVRYEHTGEAGFCSFVGGDWSLADLEEYTENRTENDD